MFNKTSKWIGYDFNYGHYDNPPREGTDENDEMKQFFKDFRSDLKAALKGTNFKVFEMKKNYYDVSLVVSNMDESKFVFISLGDMRYTPRWNERILVRSMKHSKDWTGGPNTFCSLDSLIEQITWVAR